MPKPSDTRVLDLRLSVDSLSFRAPLKFGGRIITLTEIMNVHARVQTRDGREAAGFGSMPIGNVWAWPSSAVDADQSAAAMRRLAERMTQAGAELKDFAHPLDHVKELSGQYDSLARLVAADLQLPESFPRLAILVAASPLDAALHDAFGKANGINSFQGLSADYMSFDLAHYLNADFKGEYLDRYTLRQPKPKMPLYHLVGALDPLTDGDLKTRIDDGLPETLGEWITYNGLTHLKIKLAGDSLDWDVDRVVAVDRVAGEVQAVRRVDRWYYSVDFNEKCESVEYVLEFLHRVSERAPAALERIQYIEQPTHRDLATHRHQKMHAAARIKPVVIDESLVDFQSLLLARELGYSGVALKACKGHTEALLMAAAAQKYDMFLCVQDLTCPGASFLHSAELSARIPGVAAIEGNARQYCPAGNKSWEDKFPTMFRITDGQLGTHALTGIGLGH
jgi:L-alanine-DL-glutamate epimerase-like enolase superfamily enzyme